MNAKDVVGMVASACAVIAFVAGTATSTVYAGLIYLGVFAAPIVILSLRDGIEEKRKDQYVTTEVLRERSLSDLYFAMGFAVFACIVMIWDAIDRGSPWNQSFGVAQLAGSLLGAGAGVILFAEWRWWLDRRYKKCPDCAQKVLVEARKCQHCSYRFDTPEPA
jgi:hypothetical protein